MAWVGSELAISARKSGRRGKVGHTAANRLGGFAQQSTMLNKEVVKWKEKGDCEEEEKNELSLCYSLPPGVSAAGTGLLLCTAARGIGPSLNFQLAVGSWGQCFSCAWKLTFIGELSFLRWQLVSLDPLQRLKRVGFILREKARGEQEDNLRWDRLQGECAMLGH